LVGAFFLSDSQNHIDLKEIIGKKVSRHFIQSQGLGHNKSGTLGTSSAAELSFHVFPLFGSVHFRKLIVEKRTSVCEIALFHDLASLLSGFIASLYSIDQHHGQVQVYFGKGKKIVLPFLAFFMVCTVRGSVHIYQEGLLQTTCSMQKTSLLQGKPLIESK
jgi:hypothetical protein